MSISGSLSVQKPRGRPASSASSGTSPGSRPKTSQHHEHQREPACPKAAPQASIMSIIGNQSAHQPPKPASNMSISWSLSVQKTRRKPPSSASLGTSPHISPKTSQHHEHQRKPVCPIIRAASQHRQQHRQPARASASKPASITSISRSLSVQKPRRKAAS